MKDDVIPGKIFSVSRWHDEGLYYYLSFLIWPFGVMLAALSHWKKHWSKNIFWIFCIYFGLTFIIAEEGGADSDRYARLLTQYAYSDLNLEELWGSFFAETSSNVDIVQPLITYLVSRLTYNASILFATFGFIFGYFYSRNVWYILHKFSGDITPFLLLLILSFALINPIWNINGFRMWTAAQIFLFGVLPYLLEGNIKRLFWSVISVLFHFSFMLPLIILFSFIILKNRINIYLSFFIITSFIKEINLQSVNSALSFLPGIFQSRVSSYTNPEYAELIRITEQSFNWYIPFSIIAIKWVVYSLTFFIYFFGRKFLITRKDLMTLFCFSLLFYGCANIASLVPSGGRFLTVANGLLFAFFILIYPHFTTMKGSQFVAGFSIPLLLLFCIVVLRVGMDYFGLMTIIGNPLLFAINAETIPLIEVIKSLR